MRTKHRDHGPFQPPASYFQLPRSGFTLIELVLVAVVLGILLVGTMPSFLRTADRLRVEQAAFEMTQLLRYARERAVSEGQEMSWVWDDQLRRARIERDEPAGASGTDGGAGESGRFLRGGRIPARVTVEVLRHEERVDRIRFFPDGTSEPAIVSLVLGGLVYTVEVDEATGQPRLSAGTPAH